MSLSSDLTTKSSLLSVLCIPQSSAAKKDIVARHFFRHIKWQLSMVTVLRLYVIGQCGIQKNIYTDLWL